jgi:O-antigen biosynthesis protein
MVIRSKLKESKYYDQLRKVKNDFKDDFNSLKYKISSVNVKLLNSVSLRKYLKKEKALTESQKKELYEFIINKNASLVDLYPFKDNSPLVSIIILNRNGIKHLKRLFTDFEENVQYPAYELIVVDNASTDKSIDFLEDLSDELHLKIIKNTENESFSKATNHAAKIAEGEYLLLLNNDIEPTYGWLNQMMQTALESDDTGAVGAKLVYPDCSKSHHNKTNSFKIQHTGVAFKEESGFIKPYNIGKAELFGEDEPDEFRAAVTAATLLVSKDKYWEVNGMDEKYIYGYEDVDFCLKLLKKGYKNIYCPKALLFHYEFGTQEKNKNKEIKNRRLNNQKLFRQKWNSWLRRKLLMDKLNNNLLFSEKPLKVAFAVTETGKDSSAGDYLTALTFGESLKKFGWEISFLSRRGHGDWYEVEEDVDVLISMLDAYNISKIRSTNNLLIKIAWPRNWIDRWISHPNFKGYNLVFAPSETACNYIENKTGIKTLLLPIATNPTRFNTNIPENEELKCDYCFTGSYWNDPREIIEMLDPEILPYTFKLYGENWDKIDKFKNYNQGFINYSKIPEVYRSTKIVVDDANRVTKRYGSVNSRVYDALASGALVITNGEIGANETFEGKLPVYRTKEELNSLIEYYMSHEDERRAKIKQLQKFVLENHTYDHRAETLKDVLKKHTLKTKIAIKIPAPNWETIHEWGDYHMALGLKKELEKENCDVILQVLPEWEGDGDARCDAVIVLRGLSRYKPKKQHFNIMWNISHPNDVSIKEYSQYDHVFIASEIWAEKIGKNVDVPVEVMLQCTDPELFYPDQDDDYKHDLLFVGNSRKVYRKIMKDLLPTNKDLAVYGTNWEGIIPEKYIKGEHIPNRELRKAYSSCKILLNDHWDDMREEGFISNRLFDGFAAGAFIISDNIRGAEVFGDALVTYDNPKELSSAIGTYLNKEEERIEKIEKGKSIVKEHHTFQKRVERILEILDKNLS